MRRAQPRPSWRKPLHPHQPAIFSGHAFLNDVTDEESFYGWLAAAGFNVSDPLAIVVEFGRHAKDLDALDLGR